MKFLASSADIEWPPDYKQPNIFDISNLPIAIAAILTCLSEIFSEHTIPGWNDDGNSAVGLGLAGKTNQAALAR